MQGTPPNKIGSLINVTGWGSPPKRIWMLALIYSVGGIRIGPVIDQKGFRRHLEGLVLIIRRIVFFGRATSHN